MKRLLMVMATMLIFSQIYARNERDTLGVGMAVSFTENLGQWDSRVQFEAQLHDAALFLEADGITVALRSHVSHPWRQDDGVLRAHAYKMRFSGSLGATPEGEGRQKGYSNYYLGSDPARWRSGVGSYSVVRYRDIWDNIDMEIYSASSALKYNMIVHTGGDPSQVVFEYDGTDGVEVTGKGYLRIRTSVRDVIEVMPFVYQEYGGGDRVSVEGRWRVEKIKSESGKWKVWIEVGNYDHSRDLVIDPVLIFSTYTGSTADNWGTTAAYDSHRNAYTAGLVFGMGYPVTLGVLDTSFNGNCDVAIFKFDSTGTNRLYATYLGGSQADMPHSLFVNAFDELLVFGSTGSQNFPVTPGAYQSSHAGGSSINYENASIIAFPNGSDIFVSRLSADGTQLQASTYVGGSGNDGLNYRQHYNNNYSIIMQGNDSLYYNYGDGARGEIITDQLNNVYIGSTTFSLDFPTTPGSLRPLWSAGQEGVVFKLDHNLRNMLWSTYLGGYGDDAVYSIDVDSAYNLLVCGGTNSINFPVTDSTLQTTYGGGSADGFVSKISYDGQRLMASTFIGARFYDQIYFVRVGRHDEVCVFGQTKATGATMIHNAGYSVYGSGMLLARLSPDLRERRWSTVFGTTGRVNLSPTGFAADICNRVYAAGWGRDFVGYNGVQWNTGGTTGMETTPDAYQDSTDGQDFYIISLDADAATLEYASFFGELHHSSGGSDHVDGGTSRFDRMGTLYQSVCASCGGTDGFPTTAGAWSDSNLSSNCNNALFRFNVTDDFPVADFLAPETGCAPYTVQFTNTGRGTSYHWDFGDGTTSTEVNPSHTYTASGIYTITLIAIMPSGCSYADTMRHTVQVLNNEHRRFPTSTVCNDGIVQIGPEPQLGASYMWLVGEVSDPTVANPWVSNEGTYVLLIHTAGCNETDTFSVREISLVQQWQPVAISCHDSVDGQAVFQLGNGILADSLTYSISPARPSHISHGAQSALVFDSLAAGSYSVTISGYGCIYELDFRMQNPDRPYYEKEVSAALCNDSCTGWIHIRYNLSTIPEVPPMDTIIEGLCEGAYATHLVSLGCPLDDTTIITRSHSLDSLHVWADRYRLYLGESVRLHAEASDGVTYEWSPAIDIDQPTSANPLVTPSDTTPCYTVVATDPDGCTRSDTVCLYCGEVICGAPLFTIPNAFTPNGDGQNDQICFNADEVVEFHIAIFNRWGERVYESYDVNQCWDGTYRGNRCLPGVYTYTCHIGCPAGKTNDFKGDITLIR